MKAFRFSLFALILLICAETLNAQDAGETPPTLTVRLDLFGRTYPDFSPDPPDKYPGPILYCGYVDLQGKAELRGSPEIVEDLSRKILNIKSPKDWEGLLHVAVRRNVVGKPTDVMKDFPMEIKIKEASHPPKGKGYFAFDLVIPVGSEKILPVGIYTLELGLWYTKGTARKTVGSGLIPFEVRTVEKGSGDEINLLTASRFDQPKGIGFKLDVMEEYKGKKLIKRILELDPHDIFAKKLLINIALQLDASPERAVQLYREIRNDVINNRAKRLSALLVWPRPFRPIKLPETIDQWIKIVDEGLKSSEEAVKAKDESRKRVEGVIEKGSNEGLIRFLKESESYYERYWALKYCSQRGLKGSVPQLIAMLSTVPQGGFWSKEIVNAVAAIEDCNKRIKEDMSLEEMRSIIQWWLENYSEKKPENK